MEIKKALDLVANRQMTIEEAVKIIENYQPEEENQVPLQRARKIKVYVHEKNGHIINIPGIPLWAIGPMMKIGIWAGKKSAEHTMSPEEYEIQIKRIHRKINEALEELEQAEMPQEQKEEAKNRLEKKRIRKIKSLKEEKFHHKKGMEWAKNFDYRGLIEEIKKCGPMTIVEVESEDEEEVFIRTL